MITLFTAYSENFQPLADIVLPNLQEYADRHSFELYAHCGPFKQNPEWAYPMQKTAILRGLLETRDWHYVWVLDIDLLVTNMTTDVRDFMDSDHNLFISEDINGINSGSYILKNNRWGKEWLESILSLRLTTTSEQHAIWHLHDAPIYRQSTKILSHPSINSIPYDLYPTLGRQEIERGQWEKGQLIYHLPGMNPADRCRILSSPEVQESIVR